jgi:hypothetical protein
MTVSSPRWIPVAALVACLLTPDRLDAQTSHSDHRSPGTRHAEFTPVRPATAADTARALDLARRLREAIAVYADIEAAEAAGYRMRPDMMAAGGKALVHMGNPRLARSRDAAFDPGKPQSLLYRRQDDGRLTIAGAMFTAPATATLDELDARVPLGLARWHRHVNVCRPPRGVARTVEFRRAMTEEACDRVGGRFRAEGPRYMVHVMTDVGDEPAAIFPQGRD